MANDDGKSKELPPSPEAPIEKGAEAGPENLENVVTEVREGIENTIAEIHGEAAKDTAHIEKAGGTPEQVREADALGKKMIAESEMLASQLANASSEEYDWVEESPIKKIAGVPSAASAKINPFTKEPMKSLDEAKNEAERKAAERKAKDEAVLELTRQAKKEGLSPEEISARVMTPFGRDQEMRKESQMTPEELSAKGADQFEDAKKSMEADGKPYSGTEIPQPAVETEFFNPEVLPPAKPEATQKTKAQTKDWRKKASEEFEASEAAQERFVDGLTPDRARELITAEGFATHDENVVRMLKKFPELAKDPAVIKGANRYGITIEKPEGTITAEDGVEARNKTWTENAVEAQKAEEAALERSIDSGTYEFNANIPLEENIRLMKQAEYGVVARNALFSERLDEPDRDKAAMDAARYGRKEGLSLEETANLSKIQMERYKESRKESEMTPEELSAKSAEQFEDAVKDMQAAGKEYIPQKNAEKTEKKPDVMVERIKQEPTTKETYEVGPFGEIIKTEKEFGERREKEISNPLVEEARQKRNQLLEKRGLLQMPEDEFKKYFSSDEFPIDARLNQGNTGDCYAVAAIHAMASSPHFEMIARSSMKKLPNGSWEVKIPLLSENGRSITIAPEEIAPQKNEKFLKRSKGKIMPDMRMKLKPMEGKEGLQVLEAAFIKQKFGSVDRLKAEGGWGDEVLMTLGGDNFKKQRIRSVKFNAEKKEWEYPGLSSLAGEEAAALDGYLENFDPEVDIATVSSKHTDASTLIGKATSVAGFYKGTDALKFFATGHAYSISSVDTKNKVVALANPWDTSKPIELTFDQFKKTFSGIEAIRVDSAKLLKNMGNISKKEK